MKGLTLPLNAIIIIAIALLVIASVSVFFFGSGGQQITRADAQRTFFSKCQLYCDNVDPAKNIAVAAELETNDPSFIEACRAMGIAVQEGKGEVPARCLESCPCDLTVEAQTAVQDLNCNAQCLQNSGGDSDAYGACIKQC